jgi:hypothetical protein
VQLKVDSREAEERFKGELRALEEFEFDLAEESISPLTSGGLQSRGQLDWGTGEQNRPLTLRNDSLPQEIPS